MIHTSRDDRAPELSNQTIGTRIEQPKLLIICRDNGLYGEASMHSSIALLHRGYNVSWLALPAELDGELLKCSVHDAMASERPDAVVCDYTVDGVLSEGGVRPLAILDEAFSWATGSALAKFFNLSGWGSGNPELEIKERLKGLLNPGYLRKCGEPVTALLKLALQREIPERVDIFTGRLADHLPFRLLEELIKADPSHKEFNEFSLNEDDRTVRQASKAAGYPVRHPWEEVRDWVTNAGIPEERVRVVLDYQELRPEDYTDGTVWIVGDRHLLEKPFFTRRLEERFKKEPWSTELVARARDAAAVLFSNATILRLPIETFASDLVKQTLIELDPNYVQHMFDGVAGLVTQIVERKMPLTPPNS